MEIVENGDANDYRKDEFDVTVQNEASGSQKSTERYASPANGTPGYLTPSATKAVTGALRMVETEKADKLPNIVDKSPIRRHPGAVQRMASNKRTSGTRLPSIINLNSDQILASTIGMSASNRLNQYSPRFQKRQRNPNSPKFSAHKTSELYTSPS